MIFNSLVFALFLVVIFATYWFTAKKHTTRQNIILLLASYVFYGWWDWRFLTLIAGSTLLDYTIGLKISQTSSPPKKRFLLFCSVIANLGLLAVFKYFTFFISSFIQAFGTLGITLPEPSLSLILPVGISFYTFQTLSYTIDVYRKKCIPSNSFVQFATFVSFFPQLVAGPIERAKDLLPQFSKARTFSEKTAREGAQYMLWGFFKKIVIADNAAVVANQIFAESSSLSGSTLLLGAVFFAFQIYGDFSGYSDIAIGTARLFGIHLKRNFAYPYFSRNIAEFWKRWHISLSTWFRDYVYIPLGGNRRGLKRSIINVGIVFLLSGLWHGANWTFVLWGGLHAICFIPFFWHKEKNKNSAKAKRYLQNSSPSFRDLPKILVTFGITTLGWIFFRSETISSAMSYLQGIFSSSLFTVPVFDGRLHALSTLVWICIMLITEWGFRRQRYTLAGLNQQSKVVRFSSYVFIILSVYFFGQFSSSIEFIYFQF